LKIAIDDSQIGTRLDQVIVDAIDGLGRGGAKRLFAEGRVRLVEPSGRERAARKGERARGDTTLVVQADDAVAAVADPSVELAVVHEDDGFVVIDKPAGIDSAPLRPGEMGTVANGLLARFPCMRGVGHGPREPGLCHRLDHDTSGLLVAAKSPEAFDAFTEALRRGAINKRYFAVVVDAGLPDAGRCERSLGPDPSDRRRVATVEHGRSACTKFVVLRRATGRALVRADAHRAYRHQVRVHLAALGAPLVGDVLYGGEDVAGLTRHALHASHVAWSGGAGYPGWALDSALPEELAALVG
jgi:23S rRNA pseudouridine1911/1915/1917 synthase